jgi:hypothetical protein
VWQFIQENEQEISSDFIDYTAEEANDEDEGIGPWSEVHPTTSRRSNGRLYFCILRWCFASKRIEKGRGTGSYNKTVFAVRKRMPVQ